MEIATLLLTNNELVLTATAAVTGWLGNDDTRDRQKEMTPFRMPFTGQK